MTTIASPSRTIGSRALLSDARLAGAWPSPAASRGLIAFAIAAGSVAGFLLTGHQEAAQAVHQAGPELVRLLRGMAAIKMLMAAMAFGVVLWRLGTAAAWPWVLAYATTGGAMAAGPGLIWNMAHVGAGALLLHGGLLATILLLWRDPATGQRLAAAVARRRRPA